MPALFLYLLQSSACLALFYLVYISFFRKETFYRYNRVFLLSAFLFSAVCPLLPIPGYSWKAVVRKNDAIVSVSFDRAQQPASVNTVTANTPAAPVHHWWDVLFQHGETILLGVYLAVAGILLIVHILQLLKIRLLLHAGERHTVGNFTYVYLPGLKTPFSFLHFIFLDPDAYESAELQHIVWHEQAHVNQRHTMDNLLATFYCCLCWINPFAWFTKKALQLNLEYLADEAALELTSGRKSYQYSLLKTASICHPSSIANHFSKSFIKNRIVMINTTKSSRMRVWKYLLIVPVLAIAGGLLSASNPAVAKKEAPGERYMQNVNGHYFVLITAKTTDEDIKAMREKLQAAGLNLSIMSIKRNTAQEITSIVPMVFSLGEKSSGTVTELEHHEGPIEPAFLITGNNGVSVGMTPGKGDEYFGPWPGRLLRVAAEEAPKPVLGLTTDTSFSRRFPGGKDAYVKHISQHIRYPREATEQGITGFVHAQYKLQPDGTVNDVAIVKNMYYPDEKIDKSLSDEIVRVLKELPKFNPEPGGAVETISFSAGFYLEGKDGRKPKKTDWSPDIVIVGYTSK